MRKRFIIGIGAFSAILVTVFLVGGNFQRAAGQTPKTASVQRKDIQTNVQSSGQVVANQTAALTFGIEGKAKTVAVQIGDVVKAGQALAGLDTTDLALQVSQAQQQFAAQQAAYNDFTAPATDKQITQARANLTSAQTQLATAQTTQTTSSGTVTQACANVPSARQSAQTAQDDYDNYVKAGYLADATFVPDPDAAVSVTVRNAQSAYTTAQSQCSSATTTAANNSAVSAAQANVTQAQAALDSLLSGPTKDQVAQQQAILQQKQIALDTARQTLNKATLLAPFDGTVTAVDVTIGEQVSLQKSAITLVDMSKLYFDANVDEADITQLKVDQPLSVALDALKGQPLAGKVARIVPTGQLVSGVVTYTVRVDLSTDKTSAMPGMKGHIDVQVKQSVLVVPSGAVLHDANGTFVNVTVSGGQLTRTAVVTGQTIDDQTVIISGLTEGQQVSISAS